MIRAVIFDLDGVLVSTDELHYQSWKALATELGIPFDRAIGHRMRGIGRMESLEVLLERSAQSFNHAEKAGFAARKNETFRRGVAGLTPADVLPGAGRLLAGLADRGIPCAVATSSRNGRDILKQVGLTDAFDTIVDGNDAARSKPHPDAFLLAAAQLDAAPSECVVIEDAPAGVEAARRAGMSIMAVGPRDHFPVGTPVVSSLEQLTVADLLGV